MAEYRLIEKLDDVEATFVSAITTYFHNHIRVQDMFPKFGTIRVDTTHPAAILNVALVDNKPVPGNLFPSITVNQVEDSVGPQVLNLEREVVEVNAAWVTDQLANPLANQAQMATLLAYIQNLPVGKQKVYGYMTNDRISTRVLCAIWAENQAIRTFLYAHLRACLYMNKPLWESIGLQNWVLAGTPSGLYNLDFGRVMYGAELSLTADRYMTYVHIDTSWTAIEDVNFYFRNIDNP